MWGANKVTTVTPHLEVAYPGLAAAALQLGMNLQGEERGEEAETDHRCCGVDLPLVQVKGEGKRDTNRSLAQPA